MGEWLRQAGLGSVIETGARFLLDPRNKHWPPLVAPREVAAPRVQFIRYALEVAAELGSRCVSIWSGAALPEASTQQSLDWLARNLDPVLTRAEELQIDIGFEPEPGMFIETTGGYERLRQWLDHPRLKLTLDIGHLFCMGEVPLADHIGRCADDIVNVHIEDMQAGVHDHLLFGEGDIHFPPVVDALRDCGYSGPVCVELSRHSHDAARAVKHSWEFLAPLVCPARYDALR
jgi:sugar phosphate isomerase/epimerase